MVMAKTLTLQFKTNLKTIGVDYKSGLFSVSFGHLVVLLMKVAEKSLILF
jgi:hypothetical protein